MPEVLDTPTTTPTVAVGFQKEATPVADKKAEQQKDDPNNPYYKVLQPFIVVPRGEGEQTVEWKFERKKLKQKGKESKVRYALQPVFPKTDAEKDQWLKWVQREQLVNTSHAKVSGMSTNWTETATKYTGEGKAAAPAEFSEARFIEVAATFSARGETIKSLTEEKEEINAKIVELASDTSMAMPEKMQAMNDLAVRLKEVMESIEDRKQKPSVEEADEEEAVKA
jgi:hypothetical protein